MSYVTQRNVLLPSLFLFLGRVVLSFMAGRPDQRVSGRLVTCAPLGVQARALHETRRDAKRVPQTSVLLLLRLRDRVCLANTDNQQYYIADCIHEHGNITIDRNQNIHSNRNEYTVNFVYESNKILLTQNIFTCTAPKCAKNRETV